MEGAYIDPHIPADMVPDGYTDITRRGDPEPRFLSPDGEVVYLSALAEFWNSRTAGI